MSDRHVITFPCPLGNKHFLSSEQRLHSTPWPQHAELYSTERDAEIVIARLKKFGFKQKFNLEKAPKEPECTT